MSAASSRVAHDLVARFGLCQHVWGSPPATSNAFSLNALSSVAGTDRDRKELLGS
jgi:hypothetical protein